MIGVPLVMASTGFVPTTVQVSIKEWAYKVVNNRTNLYKLISVDFLSIKDIKKIYNFYSNLENYSIELIKLRD